MSHRAEEEDGGEKREVGESFALTSLNDKESEKEQQSSSNYIDQSEASKRATLLFQHLQAQPYHYRVRTGHSALEDVDDGIEGDTDDIDVLEGNTEDDDDEEEEAYSVTTWDSEEEERKMQQEWEDNIAQLNLALQVMVLPFFGKWLGRKWSYWAFTRYQQRGFTAAFFGLEWLWAPTTVVPSAAVALVQP